MKKRTSKKHKTRIHELVTFAILLLLSSILYAKHDINKPVLNSQSIAFSKCVDGDTSKLLIDGEERTVRFLAVDTPETKHPEKGVELYGKEASEFTCNTLKNAKKINLEYESKNKSDKYGRDLGWIWVDGELLQTKLINAGLAKVAYLYDDYKYTNQLLLQEQEAKSKYIGIWSVTNQNE